MIYTYENIKCPKCGKIENYQIDLSSNKGNIYIVNEYIECEHCNNRFYIGNSEISINIKV